PAGNRLDNGSVGITDCPLKVMPASTKVANTTKSVFMGVEGKDMRSVKTEQEIRVQGVSTLTLAAIHGGAQPIHGSGSQKPGSEDPGLQYFSGISPKTVARGLQP